MNTCRIILKTGIHKGQYCGRTSTGGDSLCHRYTHKAIVVNNTVRPSVTTPVIIDTNEAFGIGYLSPTGLDEKGTDPSRCGTYDPDDPLLQQCIRNTLGHVLENIAEYIEPDNGSIDFTLQDGRTLSVKSNKLRGKMVCPNSSGQPTRERWCEIFASEYQPHATEDMKTGIRATMRTDTARLLNRYIRDLFGCDYMVRISETIEGYGGLLLRPQILEFTQPNITFSNKKANFESLSISYNNTSLGEFQVRNKQNCAKFRFNLPNLIKLLNQ